MSERLPAHLEAAGLIRQVEAEGGFGAIVKRGDPDRGALILLISNRGQHQACLERTLGRDGNYGCQVAGPPAGANNQSLADWSEKRLRFDEDSWLIELDVPDPQRFIVELGAKG